MSISREIARPIARAISRNVSSSFFDLHGGASAAYSLYDLGNRRGVVTETGETVYGDFLHHRTDFSDNGDSMTPSNGSESINESIGGKSGVLKYTVDNTTSYKQMQNTSILTIGNTYRFQGSFYLPSTNDIYTTFRIIANVGGTVVYPVNTTTDEWVDIDITFVAEDVRLRFQLNNGSGSYQDVNADDCLYLGDQTFTELDTYRTQDVAYHNPAVRLRRDSDNIHKSFPAGAFTQMLNWANEDVETYTSDFSAGTDGWSAVNGTTTGNIDGIGGQDDNLRFTVGNVTDIIRARILGGITSGVSYAVAGDVYIPSTNAVVDGIKIGGSVTGDIQVSPPPDTWTPFDVNFSASTTNLNFVATDGGNSTVVGNGTDVFYIRNVSVTQLTSNAYATTWYDQSGVQVESVLNDTDCSTANGWTQAGNATLTVNYDSGDEGHESVFRLESGDGIAERFQLDGTYTDGTVYRVSFDHRYVTNNATKGRIFVTATQYGDITPSATWTRHELIWTQVGAGTSLRLYIDNNDGDASDEWLFDNIKVEVLDKAHNDAIQTTADNQPKVVDAGVLVTDDYGNYSLDFDGVDDSLVVTNLVNEFENTDFQLTAVGSNVYAGLVSGSVPRLYFRDTAYSYDALSIITYTNPALAIQTWECVGSAHEVFHDGSSVGTATQAQTAFGPTDFAVGQSAAAYRDTNISALLFYASDQSANRSAIEQSLSKILTTALS